MHKNLTSKDTNKVLFMQNGRYNKNLTTEDTNKVYKDLEQNRTGLLGLSASLLAGGTVWFPKTAPWSGAARKKAET